MIAVKLTLIDSTTSLSCQDEKIKDILWLCNNWESFMDLFTTEPPSKKEHMQCKSNFMVMLHHTIEVYQYSTNY